MGMEEEEEGGEEVEVMSGGAVGMMLGKEEGTGRGVCTRQAALCVCGGREKEKDAKISGVPHTLAN